MGQRRHQLGGIDDVTISNGRLSARILSFGASLADLRLAGVEWPLVLGFKSPEAYIKHGLYFGAVIGRYANRIANARTQIKGETVILDQNDGPHHLHGGRASLARRRWKLHERRDSAVVFKISSPDGEGGYPGKLWASAIYSIVEQTTLRLDLVAECDRPSPVNLCHHPYFNLAGGGSISEHSVIIRSDHVLPSDDELIPTGELLPTVDTQYDLRSKCRMAELWKKRPFFNNTYCRPQTGHGLWNAARLECGSIAMDVATDQPGIHFYDGYKVATTVSGHGGCMYGSRQGLCLEGQNWPDSPNRPDFPEAILLPGEVYRRRVEYRFSRLSKIIQ
ncbi:aldose epimerase family protein [Martelella mediterranea]|uniref:Aldose 1-epimerase n=1 Tax=Martelella mediterranea TaxID=293089 RepID=A0A4R3NI52_9HYPH|nr:aldose epimerase family protein [Martelella mediterranea]TCT31732.1 aldose 1-epimerase [Martelella mediterranea]